MPVLGNLQNDRKRLLHFLKTDEFAKTVEKVSAIPEIRSWNAALGEDCTICSATNRLDDGLETD